MSQTTKTSKSSKTVKPLYNVSRITKSTNSKLWVAYPAGDASKGLVFSSTWNRDQVRSAIARTYKINKDNTRSRRVSNFRKISA